MFQIVNCCRKPFLLYELLGATLFPTTRRGTYPEMQTLLWDQMERRLYSRSAGLLDAPGRRLNRDDIYLQRPLEVYFIHQTVKEYMNSDKGGTIILQDIGDEPHDNGYTSIFRYLVSLLTTFGNQSASRFVEHAMWRFTKVQQRGILTNIFDQIHVIPLSDVLIGVCD